MNGNDRAIVGLVMGAHAMVHTYELSIPILVSVWLVEFDTIAVLSAEFPVNAATLGVVVSAGYALFGLGALLAGVLADTYGSRPLIALCLFGMGGSFLLLGLAPGVVVIALALVCWGAAASVYHPSGLALISKGVHERGSAFAYHGMAGNLGIALGPLATTVALLAFDWRAVVGLLAIPALIAGLFALRADIDETAAVGASEDGVENAAADGGERERSEGEETGGIRSFGEFLASSKALFTGVFVLVFGVAMLSGLYYRGVLTFLPEILTKFPAFQPVEIAGSELQPERYFYAGLLMVGVLGQYVGGRLTDYIRPAAGIAGGYGVLGALAILFLPVARAGIVPLLIVGAALGFFLFFVQPLYQAAIAEFSPPEARGISYGYTYLGVFGIGALGGTIAGAILTALSPAALFATLAGFGALAALLGVAVLVRTEGSLTTV
ncbi:MFS transporter [Halococcus saccharolyticus]|uniref:Sugar phosphate permease n=1 Tax=Halococcus saccharolyticus DSM 5350 TaxID=1227455 RepID=M0MPK6_9EURY|nr:MFS transporter [Halococcus saccharolyticus]EMA47566.1 sugar phosphate permease [Halococcus saccharolyticus DSM 5350]